MNRRDFSQQAAVTGMSLALGLSPWVAAHAQAPQAPVEGTHYVTLSQRAPVSVPAGKIEVVEFFWYGCPHCNHFEPSLVTWAAKLPPDVVFRRVPVAFRETPFVIPPRLYFALEAMGLVPEGQGARAVLEGWTAKDGRLPVNRSGGLKSKGHPIGATGVSMHVLSAMQLTGEAGDMQLPRADRAGIFNMGGAAVANYVSVLERAG